MVISQGDVWWVNLPQPVGGEPGFRRPVVVVQSDPITLSGLSTVVGIPLTGNLGWSDRPGCAPLRAEMTGLPKDSVALTFQIQCMDRASFTGKAGTLSPGAFQSVLDALDAVLGR